MKTLIIAVAASAGLILATGHAAMAHDTCKPSCQPAANAAITSVASSGYGLTLTIVNTCNRRLTVRACPAQGSKGTCGNATLAAGQTTQINATSSSGKMTYHWHCT
jgi:hypothetical protein